MISISRRNFLLSSGAWLASRNLGNAEPSENFRMVSLIHTTDLHGHVLPPSTPAGTAAGGFARCASQIRTWRKLHPDSLLFDVGDLYQGTPESFRNEGSLMVRLLNQTGYDAWVPGNHDFDWGADVAARRFAESKPAVLCANLTHDGSGAAHPTPWTIRESAGLKIGIIGLITPALSTWLAPETLGPFAATDPAPALERSIREARAAGARAIVVLAHMGWRRTDDHANPLRALLRRVSGVDVLLAGHTHQNQPSWTLGKTLCSQASCHGIHCGRVELRFDPDQLTLRSASAETVHMDESVPLDPAVLTISKSDLKDSNLELSRPIATAMQAIPAKGPSNPLASLFCEAFAHSIAKTGQAVDGVLHGTFGTGGIEAGPITIADCWRLLPYDNRIVTARIGAMELIEIIRECRKSGGPARLLWPFTLHMDAQGAVSRFRFKNQDVTANSRYTIACNSYDSQSAGRSLPVLHEILQRPSSERRFSDINTRTALIDFLADRGVVP